MLRETDDKIETIASETGFRDATALGVAFRRNFGISPKNWRKQEQAKKA
jgi:transcriptional regulator GlxA family with amidase domain